MAFTKEQIEQLRNTSMRDILAAEGYDTAHTRGNVYYSPFRAKERTPSFHIDDAAHMWFDYGDPSMAAPGKASKNGRGGGDTIDFVRILKGLSFRDALEYLCRYNPGIVPDTKVDRIVVPRREDKILADGGALSGTCTDTKVTAAYELFTDRGLISYAASRGVGLDILQRYTREVHYECAFDGGVTRRFHAIGFPNSDGGWMLRWNPPTGRGKRSTGGGATLISCTGGFLRHGGRARCGSVTVFEGFFDFLSWMEDYRPDGTPGDTDIVVLNSVANLHSALPFILQHRNCLTVFDNDKAGEKATREARQACADGGIRHFDFRHILGGAADYNDAHVARLKETPKEAPEAA